MKAPTVLLIAATAAVTLVSVASARPDGARQRIAIASQLWPEKTFVLTPVTAGALERDSGTVKAIDPSTDSGVFRFTGKRGTFTIQVLQREWVNCGDKVNGSVIPATNIGPWKFVRGTGQYAGVSGGGKGAQAGLGDSFWYARWTGLVTP